MCKLSPFLWGQLPSSEVIKTKKKTGTGSHPWPCYGAQMEPGIRASGTSWEEVTHVPPRVTEKKTSGNVDFIKASVPQVTVLAQALMSVTHLGALWLVDSCHIGCVSIQGLHTWSAVPLIFRGDLDRVCRKISLSQWDSLALDVFPGCITDILPTSMRYP